VFSISSIKKLNDWKELANHKEPIIDESQQDIVDKTKTISAGMKECQGQVDKISKAEYLKKIFLEG